MDRRSFLRGSLLAVGALALGRLPNLAPAEAAPTVAFPEGTFFYMDGIGPLEVGIVRDSLLNATNDYQIWGETFENLGFVGVTTA